MTGAAPTMFPATAAPATTPDLATHLVTTDAPRRAHADSVNEAFEALLAKAASATPAASRAEDLLAVRKLFQEVAIGHVSQVRNVMLELRFGQVEPACLVASRPALGSLRTMAAQLELVELCAALDDFCAAVDAIVPRRASPTGAGPVADTDPDTDADKAELLRRYDRLIDQLPHAFELDAERDRREPIILEALLHQVDGVERLTIEKLFAVGLDRLDTLRQANAADVVAVSGIRPAIAAAIIEHLRACHARAGASVAVRDPVEALDELATLLRTLSAQNEAFARAASDWSEAARATKRTLRKQREHTFQQIKVALARLGEREQLSRLEKLPFHERIANLERFLSAQPRSRGDHGTPIP